MKAALVVGAGIAGLATALRLQRSGWQVTVVERADGLRGGAYMIGFSGIGYDAARDWGLIPALREMQPVPVDLVYVEETGNVRARMPVAASQAMLGSEQLALLRGDLEAVLFKALDGEVDVRFSTSVTRIVQDGRAVTARLTDQTELTVDLLVGADGLHSVVRELVFGPEEAYRRDLGYAVATFLLDHVPARLDVDCTMSMGLVGRGVGVYKTRSEHGAGFFSFASDDLDADMAAGATATLRRRFGDLGWVVPELLDQVDACDRVYFDRISQIVMNRWSAGRVVLVGDAAWCVTLFGGYGSSLALGGAELLGKMLDEHGDLPAALQAWEQQLRPLAEKKQRQGRRARHLFVAPNEFTRSTQLAMYRLAGSKLALALARRFLGLEKVAKAVRA